MYVKMHFEIDPLQRPSTPCPDDGLVDATTVWSNRWQSGRIDDNLVESRTA
jgi:hypothetical protein